MKKLTPAILALFFLLPNAGFAQLSNSLGIGPRLGYYKGKDADSGNLYIGGQVRAHIGKFFGLEGAVDYRTAQKYKVGPGSADVRQIPVTVSALLYLPISEHFEPYGIAGLGAYYSIIDYNDAAESVPGISDDHSVDFGYHLGAGIELPLNQHIALDVDYRYIFLDPGSDTFGDVNDANFSGNVLTAGLTFYL